MERGVMQTLALYPVLVIMLAMLLSVVEDAEAGTNYDESKVPKFTLPDPLVMENGERVKKRSIGVIFRS